MAAEKLFVDTNVLVYATDTQSPFYVQAVNALDISLMNGADLVISSQVLREYLAVTTRLRVSNPDVSLEDILESVRTFRQAFEVAEDNDKVLNNLLNLLGDISVAGKQIHDANIVATMQANNIRSLLTHNTADFKRFSHLIELIDI